MISESPGFSRGEYVNIAKPAGLAGILAAEKIMGVSLWADIKVGFLFENYAELNQKITGEEYFDDAGPIERWAAAFRLDLTVTPFGVIFSITLPFARVGEGESGSLPLDFFNKDGTKRALSRLKEKLTVSGFDPDEPVILKISEYC